MIFCTGGGCWRPPRLSLLLTSYPRRLCSWRGKILIIEGRGSSWTVEAVHWEVRLYSWRGLAPHGDVRLFMRRSCSWIREAVIFDRWELADRGHELQMRGWWESNINVWFRFMYFQKRNCGLVISKNRIIMFCFPISTFMYLVPPQSVCRGPNVGIYKSLTNAWRYRNWEQGSAVSFLGIYVSNFRCSVVWLKSQNFEKYFVFIVARGELHNC